MWRVASGVIGASLTDFLTWTVKDYQLAVEGYKIKQREEWEKARMISYYSVIAMQGSAKIKYSDIKTPIDEQESAKGKKRVKWQKRTK
jgi:hypothetical protein